MCLVSLYTDVYEYNEMSGFLYSGTINLNRILTIVFFFFVQVFIEPFVLIDLLSVDSTSQHLSLGNVSNSGTF